MSKLSKGRWHKLDIDYRDQKMPERIKISGNYAIFVDGKLRYIGESQNLAKRLNQHIFTLRNFLPEYLNAEIKIRPEKESERYRIEQNLILKLKPPGNHSDIKIMKNNIFEKFKNIEIHSEKDSKDLKEYNLSTWTINALKNSGRIRTLEELKKQVNSNGLERLYIIRNFGRKCMKEVMSLLEEEANA